MLTIAPLSLIEAPDADQVDSGDAMGRRIGPSARVSTFPKGGVFSITNRMRDRALIEVTVVLRASRYGRDRESLRRLRVLKRRQLQAASCECYGAIRRQYGRLGL